MSAKASSELYERPSSDPYRFSSGPKIRPGLLSDILYDFYQIGVIRFSSIRIQEYIQKCINSVLREYINLHFRGSLREVLYTAYLDANSCVLPIGSREDFELAQFSIESRRAQLALDFTPDKPGLIPGLLSQMLENGELIDLEIEIYSELRKRSKSHS